jgi:hypothetical protein
MNPLIYGALAGLARALNVKSKGHFKHRIKANEIYMDTLSYL